MEKNKWLIIKAGLLLFTVVLFFVIHWSMIIVIWETKSKIQSHRKKVEEARLWKNVTSRLERDNSLVKAELSVLNQKALREDVLSGVIKSLQSFCRDTGVQFGYIKPGRPRELAQYQELTVELGLSGKFHDVGKFLYLIESSENLMAVQSLEITTENMITMNLNITLKIVMYLTRRD